MTAAHAHFGWTWPLLLALALWTGLFHGLGTPPLFDVDEGAFGEATREMLARGDYVSTWLNDRPRFDKPILTYWLQALSVQVFGLGAFALRLPSALAATAWIAAIYTFACDVLDRGTARTGAFIAAFIAATSVGVIAIGRAATADALLNLFLGLALFDVYRELVDPRPRWRRRVFLWMALGMLTKGPIALLVPGGVGAVVFALQGRGAGWWRAVRDPVGWLILLGVAGPWYVLEYARRGDAFLAGFFMRHNVERFLVPLQGHAGGPLYYLPALLVLVLPYTGLLLATLPGLRHLRATPLDTFLWCWFLFVATFFTLAGTKLPHYLLYGATPLFILMARRWTAGRPLPGGRVTMLLPALLFVAAVAVLPPVLRHVAPTLRNVYVREALAQPAVFGPAWQGQALALVAVVLALAAWPARRDGPAGARPGAGAHSSTEGGPLAEPGAGMKAGLQAGPLKTPAPWPEASLEPWRGAVREAVPGAGLQTGRATGPGAPRWARPADGPKACGEGRPEAAVETRPECGRDAAPATAPLNGAKAAARPPACAVSAGARGGASAWPRIAAAALACSYALTGLLLPAAAELQQGPVERAALLARQAGWSVRSWRINVPSFSIYRGAVTPVADVPRAGEILLTRSDALAGLGPARVMFREGGVLLVRVGG